MSESYDPQAVESAAQTFWEDTHAFEVTEDASKTPFYCLAMLPYPSGALHMGHVRNYTIGDVISRFQRMRGRNVLQPMGWDAFGLPAENAAIQHDTAPAKWTRSNIQHMRGQFKRMGFAYDWSREIATCDPDYYVHEQRMFVRLLKEGMAYRRNAVVNWDPVDQTVLANEQVVDGRGWRTGAVVQKREIPQWFLKITDYAQELLDGLDELTEWPEAVKTMQRHWIGRSEGLEIRFEVAGRDPLTVFTTRPDTLMGATYVAIAAEHPLARAAAEDNAELADFLRSCRSGGVSEAEIETQEKRGMPTGFHAVHPVSGEELPVWVANFVLMGYGTGAVMCVPGHDERDREFAATYDLPIRMVVASRAVIDAIAELDREVRSGTLSDPMTAALHGSHSDAYESRSAVRVIQDFTTRIGELEAYSEHGTLVNSGPFDGMDFEQAFEAVAKRLEADGKGRRKVNWRLRDWGVSRQRYWGCPIPVIHCERCGAVPVPEDQLPVTLPEDVAFSGVQSPLKTDPAWRQTTCPECGGAAERETDTFDTFMESSWYYARYTSTGAATRMIDRRADYWLPVDQYIGGIEHAIMHLLYFRFYHKLLRDHGEVTSDEPARRLLCQGMVIAETFYRQDRDGMRHWFNPSEVDVEHDERGRPTGAVLKADGKRVELGPVEKMSKSKNNGVDPHLMIDKYGADTVRLFAMFAAPPDQSLEWSDAGVEGMSRFLKRFWREVGTHAGQPDHPVVDVAALDAGQQALRRQLHQTIAKVGDDYGRRQSFNTAIAALMELLNHVARFDDMSEQGRAVRHEALEAMVLMLNPVTPHASHALWQVLGHERTLLEDVPWPLVDENALARDTVTMAVQVNGKLRGTIDVATGAPRAEAERAAMAVPGVQPFVADKQVRKVVVVPGKIVNIVV